jgi:hypothetical protein
LERRSKGFVERCGRKSLRRCFGVFWRLMRGVGVGTRAGGCGPQFPPVVELMAAVVPPAPAHATLAPVPATVDSAAFDTAAAFAAAALTAFDGVVSRRVTSALGFVGPQKGARVTGHNFGVFVGRHASRRGLVHPEA